MTSRGIPPLRVKAVGWEPLLRSGDGSARAADDVDAVVRSVPDHDRAGGGVQVDDATRLVDNAPAVTAGGVLGDLGCEKSEAADELVEHSAARPGGLVAGDLGADQRQRAQVADAAAVGSDVVPDDTVLDQGGTGLQEQGTKAQPTGGGVVDDGDARQGELQRPAAYRGSTNVRRGVPFEARVADRAGRAEDENTSTGPGPMIDDLAPGDTQCTTDANASGSRGGVGIETGLVDHEFPGADDPTSRNSGGVMTDSGVIDFEAATEIRNSTTIITRYITGDPTVVNCGAAVRVDKNPTPLTNGRWLATGNSEVVEGEPAVDVDDAEWLGCRGAGDSGVLATVERDGVVMAGSPAPSMSAVRVYVHSLARSRAAPPRALARLISAISRSGSQGTRMPFGFASPLTPSPRWSPKGHHELDAPLPEDAPGLAT